MRNFLLFVFLLLAACGEPKRAAVRDLSGREDLSFFRLASLRGARDGDRLQTQAVFSDTSSILTIDMGFAIGSPTVLASGSWRWARDNQLTSGTVAQRSVMFLGGQSGPPSIGGTFDLLGQDGAARYRVVIPTTELNQRLNNAPGSVSR